MGISHLNAKNIDELDEYGNQIVEVFVGEDSNSVIEFIREIKKKVNYPKKAIVESIEVVDEDYKGNIITTGSFSMRLTNSQLVKMADIGNVMIEKQEETVKGIIDLRSDLKSYLNERFVKIEEDVFQIKKKLCLV